LVLDGRDLRPEPHELRRDLLTETLYDPLGGLALSEAIEGEGATIFRHACALNLEGIVSKRRSARYRSARTTPGARSGARGTGGGMAQRPIEGVGE
jgi:bifunctional non-homologous end joining protein LigD